MALLRLLALTTLLALAFCAAVLVGSALVSILVVVIKLAAVTAAVCACIWTVRFWKAGRGGKRRDRQERGLSFKVRRDLHLLRHLGQTTNAQIEAVLRRHGVYSGKTCAAARIYLHQVTHVEPRLDLLGGQAGQQVWPASDAGDLLPHTGAVTLVALHLDPKGHDHSFEVEDGAGTVHRLHHWMADYLTVTPPAGSVAP